MSKLEIKKAEIKKDDLKGKNEEEIAKIIAGAIHEMMNEEEDDGPNVGNATIKASVKEGSDDCDVEISYDDKATLIALTCSILKDVLEVTNSSLDKFLKVFKD